MSKKHDESKDIRLVSRIAYVNLANKSIHAPKSAIIGNRTWGRIDYLTHYCGFTFIWNDEVKVKTPVKDNENGELPRKREKRSKPAVEMSNKQAKRR